MTWLPFPLLQAVSWLTAPVVYHLVRYRRKLVRRNLRDSFPEMDLRSIKRVERRFYRNFTDIFFETLKLLSVSDSWMRRHMVFENIEAVDRLFADRRTVVAYFSHTGNWEWATSIALWTRLRPDQGTVFGQVYRPLRNPRWDRFFLKLRSRFHTHSFKKRSVLRDVVMLHRSGGPSITGFMSDQKPSGRDGYVMTFLNHPTAMIQGTETLARKLDTAVVYMDMERTARGHYKVKIVEMTDHAAQTAPGELTRRYAALLEGTIRRDPAIWLWSHNRWKHPVTLPVEPQDPTPQS